jgi:hypothetical protein
MQVLKISRNWLIGVAFLAVPLGAAQAGSVKTPMIFLGSGTQLVCIANNVHTAAITVVVRIIGTTDTTTQTCTMAAGDRNGCQAFKNGQAGYCTITMGGGLTNADVAARVRGVLFSRKTVAPFAMEGTVQAQ